MIKLLLLILLIVYVGSTFNKEQTTHALISPLAQSVEEPSETIQEDRRSASVSAFFTAYGSELASEAETFIQVADEYNLDFKILPAIAMVESTGGKFTPSCAPFNPFGYTSSSSPCGFYRFTSYREAIRQVAKTIAHSKAYADFQATGEIPDLAKVYCERADFWTDKVTYFMDKI